eukprot:TRINITY_DN36243_c0_g1_i1.p1 TRINITY_DN36243_c0_g1~~TRINITY_DN36243_c0_g1_i1.p1  ORF type:complete len:344 (+),score=81.05 TRINITY_DN36243_c0_g1_i1:316-1347(+)
MGGGDFGPAYEESEEQQQPLIARLFQICDVATYGTSSERASAATASLEADYERVQKALAVQEGGVLSKCAAVIQMSQDLRQLATRYKDVEVETLGLVERALDLVDGISDLPSPLQGALETNAPGARPAIDMAGRRMDHLSTTIEGTAAVHRAVGRDLEALAARAAGIEHRPALADMGLEAAPVLGGVAATALVACLRVAGPVGVLGSMALVGFGVLGAKGAAVALFPQIRRTFSKLKDELSDVARSVQQRAASLSQLASDLSAASLQIHSLLDVVPDGSDLQRQLLREGLAAVSVTMEDASLRCAACRYRPTAFLRLLRDHLLGGSHRGPKERESAAAAAPTM